MVSDEELKNFVEQDLKKTISQEDKISENVEEQMRQMGWLWDCVIKKLSDDRTCYKCKCELDFSVEKPQVLETGGTEKGLAVFCSICSKCFEELKNEPSKVD